MVAQFTSLLAPLMLIPPARHIRDRAHLHHKHSLSTARIAARCTSQLGAIGAGLNPPQRPCNSMANFTFAGRLSPMIVSEKRSSFLWS